MCVTILLLLPGLVAAQVHLDSLFRADGFGGAAAIRHCRMGLPIYLDMEPHQSVERHCLQLAYAREGIYYYPALVEQETGTSPQQLYTYKTLMADCLDRLAGSQWQARVKQGLDSCRLHYPCGTDAVAWQLQGTGLFVTLGYAHHHWQLNEQQRCLLDSLVVPHLAQYTQGRLGLLVEATADSAEYDRNHQIAALRADLVVAYLQQQGVPASRLRRGADAILPTHLRGTVPYPDPYPMRTEYHNSAVHFKGYVVKGD